MISVSFNKNRLAQILGAYGNVSFERDKLIFSRGRYELWIFLNCTEETSTGLFLQYRIGGVAYQEDSGKAYVVSKYMVPASVVQIGAKKDNCLHSTSGLLDLAKIIVDKIDYYSNNNITRRG